MTYPETLRYLYSQLPMFHRIGAAAYKGDLNTTIDLCNYLENPQLAYPAVHLAGTNGKGSTSHLIASVLQDSGYKTGLYTSPHLKDFRERIRVNGKMVPKSFVTDFVTKHKAFFAELKPSFFEMTFGMAICYFLEKQVDVAVFEAGMGGRLDSTNVVRPVLSIVTNISFDHTEFLGKTLPEIAREKAGIFKPGVPVIIGESQPEVSEVFLSTATSLGTTVSFADKKFIIKNFKQTDTEKMEVCFDGFTGSKNLFPKLSMPLSGNYQKKNAATVLAALEQLQPSFPKISQKSIYQGFSAVIKNTGLQGRWQILQKDPLIICDTGHNLAGIQEVVKQLQQLNHAQLHIVLGMVKEKEIEPILAMLPRKAQYYFCRPSIPRGLEVEVLAAKAKESGLKGNYFPTVKQAFQSAIQHADIEDVIFIGGSTFTVAEILQK